jgi:hypothetical protein
MGAYYSAVSLDLDASAAAIAFQAGLTTAGGTGGGGPG